MAISITHAFVSAKANGSDATLVQPSDWNASHSITLAAGKVLGRNSASSGAVEELALSYTAGSSGTGTGAWTGAVGTTGQRPGAPTAGMERWNSTLVAKELYNGTSWLTLLIAGGLLSLPATGRLTLETGVPVSSSDQTAKATIYFTPTGTAFAQYPAYDGVNWSSIPFTELSNDTTQSVTGKSGPAAAGPYQIHDGFVWSDAGTNRLTRGPKWTNSSNFTVTIAAPGVVTWNAHGLSDGMTWRPTATTGALPTGMAVNTDYFVTKVDANTFKISTTLANQIAGTFITTSGAQSGTHTGANYTSLRGTGAGTTELEMVNGYLVNKQDITNGPAARRGLYVGSMYFNSASQIDLKFGSLAAGWGEANIGIWNAYNRVDVSGQVRESADSWAYVVASVVRLAGASATARVTAVCGIQGPPLMGVYNAESTYNVAGSVGVAFNSSQAFTGTIGSWGNVAFSPASGYGRATFLGLGYMAPAEANAAGGSATHYGDNGLAALYQSGFTYDWSY